MSEDSGDSPHPNARRLLKSSDFSEQLKGRDARDVREVLSLPNVDEVLKELQQRHGIRIALSPALVERFQAGKVRAVEGDAETLGFGCASQDICVLCDSDDRCETCDMMDWCWSHDTHVVAE
jgi:hypothetical protein